MLSELRWESKKRMHEGQKSGGRGKRNTPASKNSGASYRPYPAMDDAAKEVGVSNATVNRVEYVVKRELVLLK